MSKGYARGVVDKTLFFRKHESNIIIVQVHVEDIIFGSNNNYMWRVCYNHAGWIWNVYDGQANLLLRATSQATQTSDKGLIPTKVDGPWHMLRRKGVPWSLPLLLFSLVKIPLSWLVDYF